MSSTNSPIDIGAKSEVSKKLNKTEWAWIFNDWANSAFSIIVVTAVLPIFLDAVSKDAGYTAAQNTAYWSYINSFTTLLVAVTAPFLGSFADFKGMKGRLFTICTLIGAVGCGALALVGDNNYWLLLTIFFFANLGYSGSNILYDSYLTDVTTPARMDKVSSAGFGWGYLGGLIPFIAFYSLVLTDVLTGTAAYRVGFAISMVWWIVWTIPFWKRVRQTAWIEMPSHPARATFHETIGIVKKIFSRENKELALFLISYFFFIDGVGTIYTEASIFGKDIGVDTTHLLLVLLVVQLVAFPCSILFGRLAKRFGNKNIIIMGLAIYIVITIYAFFVYNEAEFWVLGILVGACQGGVQALSRSYYGQLVPKERSAGYFGFFSIFSKFSAIIGPFLFGLLTQISGKAQVGALSLSVLFIIGLVILTQVHSHEDAGRVSTAESVGR
jgi:UMF1 family MFS transporter